MNQKDIDIAVSENAKETKGFKRLLEVVSLSKVGTTTASLSQKENKTAEEWLTPDGITIQTSSMTFILNRGMKMLGLTLFASAATILAMLFSSKIVSFFSKILRSKVFTKVESFSLVEFDKFSTASLVTRSTNDINQIQNVFLIILRTTLSAPVTIII
jgi:ABC-type multidrug transport system fused ATPase/permease subunit